MDPFSKHGAIFWFGWDYSAFSASPCHQLALHDFSVRQQINAEFSQFKAGLIDESNIFNKSPYLIQRVKLLYSNVSVINNEATIDIALNVPEKLSRELDLDRIQKNITERSKMEYGIEEVNINISIIPTQIFQYIDSSQSS